jgi:hypothetical protein
MTSTESLRPSSWNFNNESDSAMKGVTMPERVSAPTGSPCWADLWTSDVERSRRFYSELFGWEAQAPSPEFGGYFMFTREGVPIAGGMGDMGDMKADNSWKIYLETSDIAKNLEVARSLGAEVIGPPTPVADLGIQAVLIDPAGARIGAWQPGTFQGFPVLGEHGSPGWFELQTRDYADAVAFYRSAFAWETRVESDTDEFRYTVMTERAGGLDFAGIMDASGFIPEGRAAHWMIYWEVDEVDAATARVSELGGSVLQGAENTPFGRIAAVADPTGSQFKLHGTNI